MRETRTSTRDSGLHAESGGAARQSSVEAGLWATVDMAVRRHALQKLFVGRAPTAAIAKKIDKARSDRDALSEPTCMLVTGETGVGKSTFLKHYAAGNPSTRDAGCLVQPVVFVELQSKMTLLSAAKALARALEDPSGGKGGLADLTFRVSDQIKAQRVEVVILDEFQHIVETGEITVNKVADWFKQVAKERNVPFVMAGMPTASRVPRHRAPRAVRGHHPPPHHARQLRLGDQGRAGRLPRVPGAGGQGAALRWCCRDRGQGNGEAALRRVRRPDAALDGPDQAVSHPRPAARRGERQPRRPCCRLPGNPGGGPAGREPVRTSCVRVRVR